MAATTELSRVSGTTADAAGRTFVGNCLRWARERHGLVSPVQASHVIEVEDGFARVTGHVLTESRWADIAYVAFVSLFAGMMAVALGNGMASLPDAVQAWLDAAGRVLWAVAVAGFAWAIIRWQRAKVPSVVYIAEGTAAVTLDALQRIARDESSTSPRNVWVFARGGFDPDALAEAERSALICLVAGATGFEPPPRQPVLPRAA